MFAARRGAGLAPPRSERALGRHFRERGAPVHWRVRGQRESARVEVEPQASSFAALAWNHYATHLIDNVRGSPLAFLSTACCMHFCAGACSGRSVRVRPSSLCAGALYGRTACVRPTLWTLVHI